MRAEIVDFNLRQILHLQIYKYVKMISKESRLDSNADSITLNNTYLNSVKI